MHIVQKHQQISLKALRFDVTNEQVSLCFEKHSSFHLIEVRNTENSYG